MFTNPFGKFVVVGDRITCQVGEFTVEARVEFDEDQPAPDEHDDGFWPTRADYADESACQAEVERMRGIREAWAVGDWFFVGVVLQVTFRGVPLLGKYEVALWGIECNYPGTDNQYLLEVANERLPEALDAANAVLTRLRAA